MLPSVWKIQKTMQVSILQGSSMNASQVLGYVITDEVVDCFFYLPITQKKKKNGNTRNILVIHYKLFTHFFSGENIIQSYSKSLVSNQDPKTWWCYSSHWLPENIHQNILKRALKCVLGRSKKSLHLVKCLPYNLTPWGAAPHSLTSHF